ncbi:hypothetical protein DOH76_23715 [Salmonella enterica subsp. enterica serovar Oranienburg]|uniref:Uncharacterized protein n=1 Tax=Salmonella diarizonae TaxID=59204 RepID=A0A5Y1YEQ0_SALDZ|nr:hypothetical protein [Salmonella enterica subsp. enterica serovar Oranienburg]ECC3916780.1 hypothetical protein [Salmonella enterica subsp. diarizonae]EEH0186466.1 hypothetical protein [Salmonella enterica subsp. enterica serovar Oranienburg]
MKTENKTASRKNKIIRTIYVVPEDREKLLKKTAYISGAVGMPVKTSEVFNYIIEFIIDENIDDMIQYFKKQKNW